MTVPRRPLGADGPFVSQLSYGTMRLTPEAGSGDPASHLCRLHDLGIDTHHSSHEYDSHSLYLDTLAQARRTGRHFQHIVKLAEPGFDDHRFDPSRLTALLDARLAELDVETITSVQWLFRTPDPQDSATRTATLGDQADEISSWASAQIETGKIRNLSFFPYSNQFAEAVMALGVSTTPTMYLNLLEVESVPILTASDGFIAIRPLAGGRLVHDPETAVRFPLLHPAVSTAVLSINRAAHVDQLTAAFSTTADSVAFGREIERIEDPI